MSRWLMTTRPERRQIRYPCNLEAKIVTNNRELDCVIIDLSRSGAGVRSAQADRLVVASEVLLKWPDYGTMAASVSHIEDDMIGLALLDGYDGQLPPRRRGDDRILNRAVPFRHCSAADERPVLRSRQLHAKPRIEFRLLALGDREIPNNQ